MDYQEAIEYFDKELKRECMVLSPILEGKKSVRAQFFEMAISAMQELQDIKANMDENLHIQISELRQAKFDIETFWEESTTLSKAMQNAVRALVEIQQYKQLGTLEQLKNQKHNLGVAYKIIDEYQKLGTLEEVRAEVEKQKAEKVQNRSIKRDFQSRPYSYKGDCPKCGAVGILSINTDYCHACGQKLDWSVSE